jgi:hypothetical protein
MKAAYSIFAVLLAAALAGCANYQAQQRFAQLNEQAKVAAHDCESRFPLTPQTIVARAQCSNTAWAPTLPTLGSNQDLFQTFMAQRLAIAEQVQTGKVTMAEGLAAISQKYSEMMSKGQRRNAIAQTAAAQQNAANAEAAAADWQAFGDALAAANSAYAAGLSQSQPQTIRLETTCRHVVNTTYCD